MYRVRSCQRSTWVWRWVVKLEGLLTTLHVGLGSRRANPSSRLNRVPQWGAQKAATTPAAAPADTKSLVSLRWREIVYLRNSPQAARAFLLCMHRHFIISRPKNSQASKASVFCQTDSALNTVPLTSQMLSPLNSSRQGSLMLVSSKHELSRRQVEDFRCHH